MNKKWKIMIYILSAIAFIALVVVLCFQFVKINNMQDKLDDLQRQKDELEHRVNSVNTADETDTLYLVSANREK